MKVAKCVRMCDEERKWQKVTEWDKNNIMYPRDKEENEGNIDVGEKELQILLNQQICFSQINLVSLN